MTWPADYAGIIGELKTGGGELSPGTRWNLALKALRMTAASDRAISARLSKIGVSEEALPAVLELPWHSRVRKLLWPLLEDLNALILQPLGSSVTKF